jgi:hypothetical protein
MKKISIVLALVLLASVIVFLTWGDVNAQAVDPTFDLEGMINSPDGSGVEVTTDKDFDIVLNIYSWGADQVTMSVSPADITWVIQPQTGWSADGEGLKWEGSLASNNDHVEAVLHIPAGAVSGTLDFMVSALDTDTGYTEELTLTVHTPEIFHVFLPLASNQ